MRHYIPHDLEPYMMRDDSEYFKIFADADPHYVLWAELKDAIDEIATKLKQEQYSAPIQAAEALWALLDD